MVDLHIFAFSVTHKWVHTKAFYSVWFTLSIFFVCPPWLYWHQLSVWYTILSTRLESLLQQHVAVSCNHDMWYKFYYYRGSGTSGALWHGYKVAGGHQTLQLGMRGEEGEGGGGGEDRRLGTIIYTIYSLQELNWKLPEGVAWTVCVKRKALAQNLRNFWKTIQWECRLLKQPLCYTIRYLFKKRKSVFASSELKKMVQFYCVRLYLGIEIISCYLLLRMARMDMDWNMMKEFVWYIRDLKIRRRWRLRERHKSNRFN